MSSCSCPCGKFEATSSLWLLRLFLSELIDSIRPPVPACDLRLSDANVLMSPISSRHCHYAPLKLHNEIAPGFMSAPKISCALLIGILTFQKACAFEREIAEEEREMGASHTSTVRHRGVLAFRGITAGARSYVTSIWNSSGNFTIFQSSHWHLHL